MYGWLRGHGARNVAGQNNCFILRVTRNFVLRIASGEYIKPKIHYMNMHSSSLHKTELFYDAHLSKSRCYLWPEGRFFAIKNLM